MKMVPKILIIAGSDSGGGAGIQADIKSASANGVYSTTAITAITAQNTLGVQAISDVPLEIIRAQIDSVLTDIGADIIKTGMLSSKEIIELVAEVISQYKIPLVLDPVMVAKGGSKLLRDSAIQTLKEKLIPKAMLVTPNIPEAEILCGEKITNEREMENAAHKIVNEFGCGAVLLKGGHLDTYKLVDILLESSGKLVKFYSNKINTNNTHGTGCSYASAIASNLAKGYLLEKATRLAHKYINNAIKKSFSIGAGHGPINHFG